MPRTISYISWVIPPLSLVTAFSRTIQLLPLAAAAIVGVAPATKPDRSRSSIATNATLNAVIPAVAVRSVRLRRLWRIGIR